jgi:dTDP-4-dehydrorhamnose 3,5-epimerase-like enzyme
LHLQINPFAQASKCLEGEILDVAVDLRKIITYGRM